MHTLVALPALAGFILAGCSGQPSRNPGTETKAPTVLGGREINGLFSEFRISEVTSRGRLVGTLLLVNPTNEPRNITVYDPFYLHVEVRDGRGDIVPSVESLGAINPFTQRHEIAPGAALEVPFSVAIPEFFKVGTGKYKIRFLYDLRLYGKPLRGKQAIVPWTERSVTATFPDP